MITIIPDKLLKKKGVFINPMKLGYDAKKMKS
jgi:hypothetical protein